MFFAFGLAFEVPVVVVVLVVSGIISVDQLREFRGYVIVAIFTLAAFITPPDAVSMISLAIPMCLLYEIGLVCARMVERRRKADPDLGKATRE
jgi:sec-independent protein translocase protein TatC